LIAARAFTLKFDGRAATAGMDAAPSGGVTELAGIATLEPYRRRGFAATLTGPMTGSAFATGCDLVFLQTTSRIAQHAYERAGFVPCGQLLVWTGKAPKTA
jgi:predicted GNAT family acetyltransferase